MRSRRSSSWHEGGAGASDERPKIDVRAYPENIKKRDQLKHPHNNTTHEKKKTTPQNQNQNQTKKTSEEGELQRRQFGRLLSRPPLSRHGGKRKC